jgi:probable rRNA maturation factor
LFLVFVSYFVFRISDFRHFNTHNEMGDPYHIAITNRQSQLTVSEAFLDDAVRRVLAAEQVAAAEISLAIMDDAEIQRVNREYLDHDCPTDVISFLLEDEQAASAPTPAPGSPRGAGRRLDGEVIVSGETALRTAGALGWNPQHELLLYVVHGLLHLCGYDDLTETERPRMRTREREMLQLWGLTPPFAERSGGESVPENHGEPPRVGAERQ